MLKLSFILPCYNVERYVGESLDSIYAQGLPENEFEVICVNDYSTDKTHEVIAAKQKEHTNLVLLDQPKNMYAGIARNRGLKVATGEYIWFVDADDCLKPMAAQRLYEQAHGEDLDLLLFNYDEFWDGNNGQYNAVDDLFRDTDVMNGGCFVDNEFGGNMSRLSLLWVRLMKRSLVQTYGIRFSDLYISEDGPFAWKSLLMAQRVKSISGRYYDYRVNVESITANKNTAKKTAVWSFQYPFQIAQVRDEVNGKVPDDVVVWLDNSVRYEVNQFVVRYKRLPSEEKSKYYQSMRAAKGWFWKFWSYLSNKNKIAFFAGRFGEKVFSVLINKMN